ncbi:ATP-binding cassette domain-containing protein, partial [Bacteroidales bacterium AH-315-I05]|nr:ATP-binding cassette domain-containing protein [Bacteroidales bacterium AH-315-I05]
MIKAKDIRKSYGNLQVLKSIDLEIGKGEIVSIVGASGAGKTTLLQIIGTLDKADAGSLVIDSEDISTLKEKSLSKFRNEKIGFVFQFHHLLAEFTALENVCIPSFIGKASKKEAESKAKEL